MARKSFFLLGNLCMAARFLAILSILLALTAPAQVPAGSQRHAWSARLAQHAANASQTPLFQPPVPYDSGGGTDLTQNRALAAGDINGDGCPDVVVANSASNTVGVLLNNGDGTFQPAVTYDSGGSPSAVVLADVNGEL